jgi:cellulose synthase/poly-beta-1,6-N-acetylglucosamine synthase-like glycosyltransferase
MAFTLFIYISAIFIAGYAFLIETYRRWFIKVPLFNTTSSNNPDRKPATFSIIIPARNEEEQIRICLESVLRQSYIISNFEVILVDDHSTDRTAAIVEELQGSFANLKLIRLENILKNKQLNSYKKKAIEVGITYASNEWIVTTDADCLVNKNWLKTFDLFIAARQPVFIAAPVAFINTGSFVSIFQCLDFMSLQGITAASVHQQFHSMCNGANLAYKKSVFNEVGGFTGIDNIASGDDMLLMHKMYKKYPRGIDFLLSKEAIVSTYPMHSWRAFFNQRIRWASKADKFDDKRIFGVLAFVYLFNCFFIALLVMAFVDAKFLWLLLITLILKTVVELRFTYPVAKFFGNKKLLNWFLVMQPVHILYTVTAGWLGKFGKYTWKGRTVK